MEQPALIGLFCGVAIGGVYVAWQARDLRCQKAAAPDGKVLTLAPFAALRLLLVAGGWWAAYQLAGADKWWLTGSLLVTYSLPLVWQVTRLFSRRGTKKP